MLVWREGRTTSDETAIHSVGHFIVGADSFGEPVDDVFRDDTLSLVVVGRSEFSEDGIEEGRDGFVEDLEILDSFEGEFVDHRRQVDLER
jgi:hypothetical protein